MNLNMLPWIGSLALLVGCAGTTATDLSDSDQSGVARQTLSEPAPKTEEVGDRLRSVEILAAARGAAAALGDDPAEQSFEALRELFARKAALNSPLYVYRLVTKLPDTMARALELGIADAEPVASAAPTSDHVVLRSASAPNLLFQINTKTGFEMLIDTARFLVNPEGGEDLGNATYVSKALDHFAQHARLRGEQTYIYQIRRYHDAVAVSNLSPVVKLSQVAVIVSQSIDGIPVIGPGAKYAVQMNPTGEVVGSLDSMRASDPVPMMPLELEDLIDPDSARQEVEATLASRGVDVANLRLRRSAFGYYCGDRDYVQALLVPYYIFTYDRTVQLGGGPPSSGIGAEEIIPAVADVDLRARLEAERASNYPTLDDDIDGLN